MEKESIRRNPNPEEIEEIKKEAIKLITERINRGDEFLYISAGDRSDKSEAALMIGGNTANLARVMSITMTKVPQLHEIVSLANEAHDHATQIFLQWFVTEQVEEEESASGVLEQLKLMQGHAGGIFMINRELEKRASPTGLTEPE